MTYIYMYSTMFRLLRGEETRPALFCTMKLDAEKKDSEATETQTPRQIDGGIPSMQYTPDPS